MTVTVSPNDIGNTDLQSQITACNTAIAAAAVGSALATHLTGKLRTLQHQLVINLMGTGRINPATVLSTLT